MSRELKNELILSRGRRCECCGNTEWLGQPINLQIHHLDFNHRNDDKSNLQLLCPNCHSYTENYNKQITRRVVSDEILLDSLRNSTTIHQALLAVHLSPSGKHYTRARKLITQYELTHLYQQPIKTNYCIDCGKPIHLDATRCKECAHKLLRKTERPSKNELYELLCNNSFVAVGKMYGVSDNAVRKWCKSYDIPYHSSDYKKMVSK